MRLQAVGATYVWVTACLCIMNLRVAVGGEAKRLRLGAGAKASPNRAPSRRRQTRNRVIYAWHDEGQVTLSGGPNR